MAMPAASALAAAPQAKDWGHASRAERLRLMLLWFVGVSSALVFIEPSPYEITTLAALGAFVLSGMAVRSAILPFLILLILINVGYTISAHALLDQKNVLTWVATSWYLAATAFFFAAMLANNTEARLATLMHGCLIAGVIAALAGVLAYFRLIPGASEFLLYDRARGTFKDPNVFGAFLILPALIALQSIIAGRFWQTVRGLMLLGLFAVAILLSFSRAAWGQLAFTGGLVFLLTFITTRSANQRLRIILFAVGGVAGLALLLAAVLSIGAVADLFKERMSLDQSYDVGQLGRFGRHILGALMALDVPFGIGPLQFSKFFPEDPHNSYLNAFMSGGWIAGVCYTVLVLLTLAFGLRYLFVRTPWQSTMIVVYSAFTGMMIESFIIDSDHWRHVFLLLGVLWGLIAATQTHISRGPTVRTAKAENRPALARQSRAA
jgi:hypothetical protein